MNTLLLVSSLIALVAAVLGIWRPIEPWVEKIYAWLPLPALILGIISVVSSDLSVTEYPNLLLGTRIGLDELGRAFLILTSAVWLIGGLYSRKFFSSKEQERFFRFYFLVTYSGTVGLTIAHDAPSFYAGYAVMTLGGYGLVTHARTASALVAGRVYIIVALFGEMLTLAGLIIAASGSETFALHDIANSIRTSPMGKWCFWLIFIGFGTKVGLVPLHFWLPMSYYWAPLPAVAVLSGAMTKAGILGWLRFLRSPEASWPAGIVMGAGALMAFYGAIVGLVQTRAKTTLAFSSLSQMGYLTMAFATTLEPRAAVGKSIAATVAFAFHHGVTKVALFLGLGLLARYAVGSFARKLVLACLAFCALALVGFPFTGGAYAKSLLKSAGAAEGLWRSVSDPVMTFGSIGTTLLMARFLVLCSRAEHDQVRPAKKGGFAWGASFAMVLLGAWLLPLLLSVLKMDARPMLSLTENFKAYLPVAMGSSIALVLTCKLLLKHSHLTPRPFDGILRRGYDAVWETLPRKIDQWVPIVIAGPMRLKSRLKLEGKARAMVRFAESVHTSWFLGCALFMAIGVLLWILLAAGGT